MKKLMIVFCILVVASCSNSGKEAQAPVKKVVCGDSIEQEMFDASGTAYTVKVAGKCDTVLVKEEK